MKLFRKDTVINGVLIALLVPGFLFGLVYITIISVSDIITDRFYENSTLLFIAINGIVLRYFMVKRGQERIGKGMLAITFALMLAWVIVFQL